MVYYELCEMDEIIRLYPFHDLHHNSKVADLKSERKVINKSKTLRFSGLCRSMK